MRLVKQQAWLCAGLIALAAPSSVYASSIQFSTTGLFSDVSTTAGTHHKIRTNDESGNSAIGWHGRNSGYSSIKFDGYSLPGQSNLDFNTVGSPFALGKLVFKNGGACGLPAINSADLTLAFLWGDASTPVQIDFGLNLTEQNSLSRKRGQRRNGDLLTLTSANNSFEFTADAGKYQLDLLGWSKDGGLSFVDSLFAANHSISRIKLYATLQAIPGSIPPPEPQAAVVPVPAAAWLLGSGLIALIGAARRR